MNERITTPRERTVGDDGEVILGPAVIVTPENCKFVCFLEISRFGECEK